MKCKHSAATLKQMSLSGVLIRCEMRSFAAYHSSLLDASNHIDFVEAFLLQLGAVWQHPSILSLLSTCNRNFLNGKIAYKPPMEKQITSILEVGRWVNKQIYGGLAHSDVRVHANAHTHSNKRTDELARARTRIDERAMRALHVHPAAPPLRAVA